MRSLLSKLATSSIVLGGALLVAACGHSDNTATADTNMTNMDTMDSSAGMSNDMSAMDAGANDAAASDANGAAPAGNAM
jgi:hypothetical protein